MGYCIVHGEALDRKQRSHALLARHGIPFYEGLPVIETEAETELRDGEEVMRRAMCLFATSQAAIADDAGASEALLDRWGLADALSPAERAFFSARPFLDRERIQMSWRSEALIPLMWATGLIDEMPFPDNHFDFEYLAEFWTSVPKGYWRDVGVRDTAAVLDQADLIYRLHWSVRDAQSKGTSPPGSLHGGVVVERHRALNWLIGYGGTAWDDVRTDT